MSDWGRKRIGVRFPDPVFCCSATAATRMRPQPLRLLALHAMRGFSALHLKNYASDCAGYFDTDPKRQSELCLVRLLHRICAVRDENAVRAYISCAVRDENAVSTYISCAVRDENALRARTSRA